MKLILVFCVAVFVTQSSAVVSAQTNRKEEVKTFCDILERPEEFSNKRIKFIARVRSTLLQPPLLVAVEGCTEKALMFTYRGHGSQVSDLTKVIGDVSSRLDGLPSEAALLFVGVLRKDKKNGAPAVSGLLPFYTMRVESARKQPFGFTQANKTIASGSEGLVPSFATTVGPSYALMPPGEIPFPSQLALKHR